MKRLPRTGLTEFAACLVAACVAFATATAAEAGGEKKDAPRRNDCFPPDRVIEWDPGVRGGIPDVRVTRAVAVTELPADETTDCSAIIQRAIDGAPTPGAVQLPAGTFMMRKCIELKSGVVLRGMGPDMTHLIVNEPNSSWHGAIRIGGSSSRSYTYLAGGLVAGSTELVVRNAPSVRPGTLIVITSENVNSEMYPGHREWAAGWAKRSVGQIVGVAEVRGTTVVIDKPIRLSRDAALKPAFQTIDKIEWAGVEMLHIKRLDKAEDSIIDISRAENCWVRDVESEMGCRGHIGIGLSRHVTVESCYVHHAHRYDGGGHGYGVSMGAQATDCLVQNNVFRVLRHAMITSMGTSGNVWAYNYSREQLDNERNNRLRDMSIHGHYSYMELFEGNIGEFATSSDWWGSAGPLVTFFRNRLDTRLGYYEGDWNAPLQILYGSHRQNVVGNSLVSGQGIDVKKDCRDVMVEGNLVRNAIRWNNAAIKRLPVSLFLDGKPHYWGAKPWPAIGADVDAANGKAFITLPAEDWWRAIEREKRTLPFAEACPVGGAKAVKVAQKKDEKPKSLVVKHLDDAPKKASPEALAVYDRFLIERLGAKIAKEELTFFSNSMRRKLGIIGIDDEGTLDAKDARSPLRFTIKWERLTLLEKRSLALATIRNGNELDYELAAFYYMATGETHEAESYLRSAGDAAERVKACFE